MRLTRDLIAVQFDSTQILPYVAVNKDAIPHQPSERGWLLQVIPPAKTSTGFFTVAFQAQYQAFVRFAVKAAQLSKAIALNRTCVLEPFTRGGLSL